MEQLLNKLLVLLDDEIDLYRSLLGVYRNERDAVLAFKLEGISTTSKRKENLILKIKILEEQRKSFIGQLATILNVPALDLTITRLAEKVDIRFSRHLSSRGAQLVSILDEMVKAQEANRSLLTHSQEMVNNSMTFLQNILTPDPVYHRDGKLSKPDQSGQLVTRTI